MTKNKIKGNKKAVLDYTMIKVIKVALITFALVFLIFAVFSKVYTSTADIEKCRISYIAAAQSKFLTGNKKIPFKCDRVEVEIKAKDVTEKGDVQKSRIMRIIAEEMRDCHYKTNEGGSNPFDQNKIMRSKPCFFCAQINFDKKLNEDSVKIRGDDFLEYLTINMKNSQNSYFEYLYNSDTKSELRVVDITTNKSYYIMYTHIQLGTFFDPTNWYGNIVTSLNQFEIEFLKIPEDGYYSSAIFLIDSDAIDRMQCSYLAN